MVEKRTLTQLLQSVGVNDEDSPRFKQHVFDFLESEVGSTELVLNLDSSDIKKFSRNLVNSEGEIIGFEPKIRKPNIRGVTITILTSVIGRWIRNKRKTFQRNTSVWGKSLNESVIPRDDDIADALDESEPSKLLSMTKRTPLTAIDRQDDNDDEVLSQYIDSEGECTEDSSSLQDVSTLCRRKGKQRADDIYGNDRSLQATADATARRNSPDISLEQDLRVSVPVCTPEPVRGTNLLSPPPTSYTFVEISDPKDHEDGYLGDDRPSKRVRYSSAAPLSVLHYHTSGELSAHNTVKEALKRAPSFPSDTLATAHPQITPAPPSMMMIQDRPASPNPIITGFRVPASNSSATHLHSTTISSFSKPINFTAASLVKIPSTILDYIQTCEQHSLRKINSLALSLDDRKKQQDRSKILRDLRADIESRLLYLAHVQDQDSGVSTKKETIEGDGEYEYSGGHDNVPSLSSYVLWD